jgi:hypothetical protein
MQDDDVIRKETHRMVSRPTRILIASAKDAEATETMD